MPFDRASMGLEKAIDILNFQRFGQENQADAAAHEPQWVNVGRKAGLRVWRIEQFIVQPWPTRQYGKFHTGDSYVILNTYQPDPSKPKLAHDIHIWIGNESSQDEYGTAAYKMVELDDKLGGAAVQHRQVQGQESAQFLQYFHHHITYLAGGVESGFRHVQDNDVTPQLFHIKGKGETLRLTQEAVRRDALNEGDVFILKAGPEKVWLWVGTQANQDEKSKGMEIAKKMCTKGTVKRVHDTDTEPEFWTHLPDKVAVGVGFLKVNKTVAIQPADNADAAGKGFTPVLYTWNGSSLSKLGTATYKAVGPAKTKMYKFHQTLLKPKLVVLLDTGFQFFVWIGSQAPVALRGQAMAAERVHVKSHSRPDGLPMTIVKQGQETAKFREFFEQGPADSSCTCVIL